MTESHYIHFNLNNNKSIINLQNIILSVFSSLDIKMETLKWTNRKAINTGNETGLVVKHPSYYNQIRFDYLDNECSVPANVFAEFYSQALNNNCKQFYLSGFNKAGSYFMNMHYKTIAELLITELRRQDLLADVIYTFDSIYQTPELFQIVNKLESKTGIVGIVK